MSKIIQKPRECRNAHCGAMCCPIQVEEMQTMWGGKPNKCPYYERRDDLYMDKSIPLEKVKQAIKEIQKLRGCSCSCSDGIIDDVEDILDRLIESEG
jgi:hypothetical protein